MERVAEMSVIVGIALSLDMEDVWREVVQKLADREQRIGRIRFVRVGSQVERDALNHAGAEEA